MKDYQLINKIPPAVLKVINDLTSAGFEAYLVGGCVRDLCLNLPPKDFDVTTNAVPEEIARVFPQSVTTYARFGTVLVLARDEHGETMPVEVTTYRSEMDYFDGRWPAKVEFTSKLSKDLGRRDFSVNAMALSIQGEEVEIIDLFGGLSDLKKGIIKAVGTPLVRMKEDGLRGFRACRLASVLNFTIEKETFDAIIESADVSAKVSIERIRDEFVRLLMESSKPSVGIELLRTTGLLKIFLPELLDGVGVYQPEFHTEDVYHHLLSTVDAAPDSVKFAALFHDIGKPYVRNVQDKEYIERQRKKGKRVATIHFYGHDEKSAELAEQIMKRMKFPTAEIKKTVNLVRWHMFNYQEDWTDAAVRRFINRVGGEEMVDLLFELRIADAVSNPKSDFSPEQIKELEQRIADVRSQSMFISLKDLEITGNDLKKLGIEEGPEMGKMLKELLEIVLDDQAKNSKEELLRIVKKKLKAEKKN